MAAGKEATARWATVRIDLEIPIAASPALVWTALTRDVGKWWPISFCADKTRAKSFHWEMRLGGRMYEDWGDGDGWIWWTICKLDAVNHLIAASGNMGGGGMLSEVWFSLHPRQDQTLLRIKEVISGEIDDPAPLIKGQIDGWNELFGGAFKPYVEAS